MDGPRRPLFVGGTPRRPRSTARPLTLDQTPDTAAHDTATVRHDAAGTRPTADILTTTRPALTRGGHVAHARPFDKGHHVAQSADHDAAPHGRLKAWPLRQPTARLLCA
jgi:hypothetical protein